MSERLMDIFIDSALVIEPGKTYALEIKGGVSSPQEAEYLLASFKKQTGAGAIIFTGGIQITPDVTEHYWREQVAQEIEARQGRHLRMADCQSHSLDPDSTCPVCWAFDEAIVVARRKTE